MVVLERVRGLKVMLAEISSVPSTKMMPEAKAQMSMRYMLPMVSTSVTT